MDTIERAAKVQSKDLGAYVAALKEARWEKLKGFIRDNVTQSLGKKATQNPELYEETLRDKLEVWARNIEQVDRDNISQSGLSADEYEYVWAFLTSKPRNQIETSDPRDMQCTKSRLYDSDEYMNDILDGYEDPDKIGSWGREGLTAMTNYAGDNWSVPEGDRYKNINDSMWNFCRDGANELHPSAIAILTLLLKDPCTYSVPRVVARNFGGLYTSSYKSWKPLEVGQTIDFHGLISTTAAPGRFGSTHKGFIILPAETPFVYWPYANEYEILLLPGQLTMIGFMRTSFGEVPVYRYRVMLCENIKAYLALNGLADLK